MFSLVAENMNVTAITKFLSTNFDHVEVVVADGDSFFFVGPIHKMPFVTLVTDDYYDTLSNLARPGVFRLNIGVGKRVSEQLFPGAAALTSKAKQKVYDFTALDELMPHPQYPSYGWICILNPSAETFEDLKPLFTRAYELAVKQAKKELL